MAVKKKKRKKIKNEFKTKKPCEKKIISSRISYYCLDMHMSIASSPDISYDKAV